MKVIDLLNALRKQPGGRPIRIRLERRPGGTCAVLEAENRAVPGDHAARFEAFAVLAVEEAAPGDLEVADPAPPAATDPEAETDPM